MKNTSNIGISIALASSSASVSWFSSSSMICLSSKIVGHVTKLVSKLKQLPQQDETRIRVSEQLVKKAYDMGLTQNTNSLLPLETLSVSSLCRRRLAVVMVRLKMSETMKEAITLIDHGHIRVSYSCLLCIY
jgi:ribosomal protein S4